MNTDPITKTHHQRITAILPAFNEGRNIQAVLDVLHDSDLLDEIFLVDDGSQDNTLQLMQAAAQADPRMRVFHHEKNRGKGQAILTAWEAASGSYLLLLDADLHALNPNHIHVLLDPVLARRADMTLGLFHGGHPQTDFSSQGAPFLTGQRGLRSDVMKHVSREAAAGYGFEIALTVAAKGRGYRIEKVPMYGVWHPPSELHRGLWYGIKWRARMYAQILRALSISMRERNSRVRAFFSSITK
ncbi:glycosyltransferase family 2 protein [bacterium]|nr:glycosyltransferase family 2 protein [bacterium]